MGFSATAQQALALLKQGPVQLVVDPDSTNKEIFVKDGIDLSFIEGQANVETDLLGIYDVFTTGDGAELTIRTDELSADVLSVLFQGITAGTVGGSTYYPFGRAAGVSMRANAKHIRLRPWQTRTLTTVQVDLWKCVPTGNLAVSLKKTSPFNVTQTFRALPDVTKSDGNLIGRLYAPART